MGVTSPTSITPERMHEIRTWCRRRADGKTTLAHQILRLRFAGRTHQQIRQDLGMTVERHRRAKKWLSDAMAQGSQYDTIDEALRVHAERQVDLVTKFGELCQQHATEAQIRAHLGLTEEGYDRTREWWLDGLAATAEHHIDDEDLIPRSGPNRRSAPRSRLIREPRLGPESPQP